MRIFADLGPPQTFALRADEILGNERQTVWSAATVASACNSISPCGPRCICCKHAGSGCVTLTPTWPRPPVSRVEWDTRKGDAAFLQISIRRKLLH